MSDPIRKVGGTSAPAPESVDAVGSSFGAALEEAAPSRAAAKTDDLASSLRSGALTQREAVDALVERALSAPAAQGLTEAGRADLARHLRNALAEDPTLRAMQADLIPDSLRGEGRE